MERLLHILLLCCGIHHSASVALAQGYAFENCGTAGPVNLYSARDMAGMPDGSIFVVGAYSGTFTFGGTTLTTEQDGAVFLAKLSEDLTTEWLMTISENNSASSEFLVPSITAGPDGSMVVAISFIDTLTAFGSMLTPSDGKGIVLLKISSIGELVWLREIDGDIIRKQGVALDNNGSIYLTGTNSGDVFVAKYDPWGSLIWWSPGGGSSAADLTWSVSLDDQGNAYVVGWLISGGTANFGAVSITPPSGSYMSGFLAKYSASGTTEWIRYIYSQTFAQFSVINSVLCHNNGVYVAGYYSDALLRFSTGGGNYGQQPTGYPRSFLAQYDPNGNLLWVKFPPYSPSGFDGAMSLTTDGTALHVLFDFEYLIQHDLGPIESNGSNDLLLERSNLEGELMESFQIGGTALEVGNHIIYHAGHIYVLGATNGASLISPSDCSVAVGSNMFIIRFRDGDVGISEPDRSRSIRISPNPTDGQCTVHMPSYADRITISDATGRSILQQNIRWTEAGVQLDLSDVVPGVYIVHLTGAGPRSTVKILVQ